MTGAFCAVDLGASSGRVVLARVAPDRLHVEEVHRFPNGGVRLPDGLHWDVVGIYREVLAGLAAAGGRAGAVLGIGVDGWAIDYGLIGPGGRLLGTPFHYRDARAATGVAALQRNLPAAELFAVNGLQHLPFTTVYQLAAELAGPLLPLTETVLLIPDLLGYWLTGRRRAELTNASTTGLLDVRSRRWAPRVTTALGLDPTVLPPLVDPGTHLGPLLPEVRESTGLDRALVTAVGSHDTASAVVGVPAQDERFAYISCGTWGLVGVELDRPVLDGATRAANFTNELGVDGTVRYLRNVMGLWILQGVLADRVRDGQPADLTGLLARAAELPAGGPLFDPDDPDLLAPGPMTGRVRRAVARAGGREPETPVELVRSVVESLAVVFARRVHEAARLSGRAVDVIHLVGGGARNGLLCQLTADAAGLPVLAGPVEATAIGNLLVQARAHGVLQGGLPALRELVARTHPPRRYLPAG